MDAKEVEDALEKMSGDLENLPDAVNVKVGLESTGSEHLEEIEKQLDIIDDGATAEVKADSTEAKSEISEVEGELQGLSDGATVEIDAEDSATPEIEQVASSEEELDGSTATITVEAEGTATETLEETKSVAEELDGKTVTLDVTPAQQSMMELDATIMGVGESLSGIAMGLGLESMVDMAGSVEDSWKRLEMVFKGTGVNLDDLKKRISSLSEETGRSGGSIREVFIKMGLVGITNVKLIEDSFKAMSVAAFVAGKPIDAISQKFIQLISMPSIRPKMLKDLGITDDVLARMNVTVDSLRESWKNMSVEERASFLQRALLLRYGKGAVEEYKNSWAGAREQLDIAMNTILRLIGDLILPFMIPALKTVAGVLQWVASGIKAIPGPIKSVIGGFLFVTMTGASLMMVLNGISKILSMLIPKWFMNTKLMKGLVGEGGRLSRIGPAIGRAIDSATVRIQGGLARVRSSLSLTSLRAMGLRGALERIRGIPGSIITSLRNLRSSIMSTTIAQKIFNREQDKGFLATVRNAVATAGATIKNVLLAAATYAVAGAQAVLNAVMSANPIFLIIMAIGALIGIILYLWKTNKGFRDSVMGVWNALKGFGGFIWSVIKPVFDWIGGAIKWITGGFKGLGSSITSHLKNALSFLPYIFMGPIGIAFGLVTRLFKSFKWPKLSMPKLPDLPKLFLNMLLSVGRTVLKWFQGFKWPKLPSFSIGGVFKNVPSELGKFFTWLFKWITNPFGSLFSIINKLWNSFFKNLLTGFYNWGKNLILNFLKGVYETFKSAGRKVLDWISSHFPHSPPRIGPLSRVSEDNMESFGAGLIGGLNRGLSSGLEVPSINLEGVSGVFTGVAGVGGGVAGSGVNINVNVGVETGPVSSSVDVDELADKVAGRVAMSIANELTRKGVPAGLYGSGAVRRVIL